MSDKILELASKHLGRTSDGGVMKPYITPDVHDPELLQPIPRVLNREKYGITDDIFTGFDIWNCYETSFLNKNGYPITGITRIVFDASTINVVESKSLKLFLNSFNMERIAGNDLSETVNNYKQLVLEGLQEKVAIASVRFLPHTGFGAYSDCSFFFQYTNINNLISYDKQDEITHFSESPELIQLMDNNGVHNGMYHFDSLRSNCRVTNQPDFGDAYIKYVGPKIVEPKSLLKYLISFRKESHFHEEVVEMIYKRLYDLNDNIFNDLGVFAFYTRRGGIDISPIRVLAGGQTNKDIKMHLVNSETPFWRTNKQ